MQHKQAFFYPINNKTVLYKALIYSLNNSNIEFYKKSLSKLNCTLNVVYSFHDFERFLLSQPPQIIIMDLELDNTDAITVIKELKSNKLSSNPYIIVCSSKADDFIQISALNSGADEFIDLPLNHMIFESKLKAICKRLKNTTTENALEHDGVYIDHEQYKVYVGNKSHSLPRLEFKLLDLLSSHPNKIFSKDEIAAEIWNNKDISSKRTIDIHIRNIRKELGDDIIKTYRGLGYCLKTS